jgi:hypothetical protein
MTREQLIETIRRVLGTNHDISFLMKLTETELETLVASIRGQVDRETHASAQT